MMIDDNDNDDDDDESIGGYYDNYDNVDDADCVGVDNDYDERNANIINMQSHPMQHLKLQ